MTRQELEVWIEEATLLHEDSQIDGCDNEWVMRFYAKEGKFYAIEFMRDPHGTSKLIPSIARDEKGYPKAGQYEPFDVTMRTETVIVKRCIYSDKEGNDITWFDRDVNLSHITREEKDDLHELIEQ